MITVSVDRWTCGRWVGGSVGKWSVVVWSVVSGSVVDGFNKTPYFKGISYWQFLCKWQVASYTIVHSKLIKV